MGRVVYTHAMCAMWLVVPAKMLLSAFKVGVFILQYIYIYIYIIFRTYTYKQIILYIISGSHIKQMPLFDVIKKTKDNTEQIWRPEAMRDM